VGETHERADGRVGVVLQHVEQRRDADAQADERRRGGGLVPARGERQGVEQARDVVDERAAPSSDVPAMRPESTRRRGRTDRRRATASAPLERDQRSFVGA
jgi:hypothetical protein